MDELFDFRMQPISVDIDVTFTDSSNKYFTPKPNMGLHSSFIKTDNAIKLAKEVILSKNKRYYCILSGNFEFGDFIEAFILMKGLKVKELTISTLSLSQNNIVSLKNLLNSNVDKLNLCVSDYFYAHNKKTAVPLIYNLLNEKQQLDFAVAGTHTKICLIETHCGKKVIMHGSANLRSSSNIEQLMIEHDNELFDFNRNYLSLIFEEYSLINKSLRDGKLWQTITAD